MKLHLCLDFHTDGDWTFRNTDQLFDANNTMYRGATIDYDYFAKGERVTFDLRAEGEPNACRWAARDLMEALVCNISTHKYYVIKDLYDLIIAPKEELLWSGKRVRHYDSLSGNYDGTHIALNISAANKNA